MTSSKPKLRKARGWTFTTQLPIPWSTEHVREVLDSMEDIECEYIIMQKEESPTTHAIHVQGYIYFPTPRTLIGVKRKFTMGNPHLEIARELPKINEAYCSKIESRVLGPDGYAYTRGECPTQGSRTDIVEIMNQAGQRSELDMWERYPVEMTRYHVAIRRYQTVHLPRQTVMPEVKVIYGLTGTGKSHQCEMEASETTNGVDIGPTNFFVLSTPVSVRSIPWADGYQGEKHVILEDFEGQISFRILLRMLDKYAFRMQVKGGFVQWSPEKVWINSNSHPKTWYREEPADTWGTGPLHRRIGSIIHRITPYKAPRFGPRTLAQQEHIDRLNLLDLNHVD